MMSRAFWVFITLAAFALGYLIYGLGHSVNSSAPVPPDSHIVGDSMHVSQYVARFCDGYDLVYLGPWGNDGSAPAMQVFKDGC